ncbi:MAG TPA: acyltransferase [Mycobacteriales bacterium]
MYRLRELAERTPASRERLVDLLRVLAIILVVLGHWTVSVIGYDAHGRLTGHSALGSLPWAYPITWLVQIMPMFFVVGGFANAASLTSHRRHGGDAITWLQDRSGRLVRPTTALLVVLAGGAFLAHLLDVGPDLARFAVWVASIPLWFLSAYLVVIVLTPVMYRLHRRFGFRVLVALVFLVALGDVARLAGLGVLGASNFVFGWLVIHQIGFFWRDGRIPFRARVWAPLLVGGLVALLLLTVIGPYPVSMINVSGQRLHNASPPTLALLATTAFQLGLVLMLRHPVEGWLHRSRPWQAVVGVNTVVLTIFLWHMSAVLLLAGALDALHVLPTPVVATRAWWLWRTPWLIMLIVVLAGLVTVFGRIETRGWRRPTERPGWLPDRVVRAVTAPVPRLLLTVGSFVAVVLGLLSDNGAPTVDHYLVGMPAGGLAMFLAGATVLRLLRAVPETLAARSGPFR